MVGWRGEREEGWMDYILTGVLEHVYIYPKLTKTLVTHCINRRAKQTTIRRM